jgi:hypothetical protein
MQQELTAVQFGALELLGVLVISVWYFQLLIGAI